MTMNITPDLIRSYDPCYDPSDYLSEDYEAHLVEFLNHPQIPASDKLWLVLRGDFIDTKTLRLFAVWCAREALKLVESPDTRIIEATNVAELFANGQATKEELDAARAAARAATRDAARAAQEKQLRAMLEAQEHDGIEREVRA